MSLGDVEFTVEFNQYLRAGSAFVVMEGFGGVTVLYRHPCEWLLHLSGAKWHPDGHRCPTWTDECRCMLGGEA